MSNINPDLPENHKSQTDMDSVLEKVELWQKGLLVAQQEQSGNEEVRTKARKKEERIARENNEQYFQDLILQKKKEDEKRAADEERVENAQDRKLDTELEAYFDRLEDELDARIDRGEDIRPLLGAITVAARAQHSGQKDQVPDALQGIMGNDASVTQLFEKRPEFNRMLEERLLRKLNSIEKEASA